MPLSGDDSPNRGAPSFSLDLPSVHGIRTELNEGIRLVEGRSIHEAPPCPKCGDLRPFRYGTKVQRFIDLPVRGVKVVVDLERQRYRCKQCSRRISTSQWFRSSALDNDQIAELS